MNAKNVKNVFIVISLLTLGSAADISWSLPKHSKKTSNTVDLVTILDISKPAFFTPQNTKWGQAPAILPPGASLAVLEGDPKQAGPFTIRLKLPENYEFPAHWCSMDEHISVISGHLFIGMGDKLDRNKSTSFPAGSYARIPLKMHHYIWTADETVIQLHGTGPWIVGYANAADDPTKPLETITPDASFHSASPSLDTQNGMSTREDIPPDLDLERLH